MMNTSKMYVPNPQKWVSYYSASVNGHDNPFLSKIQQGRNHVIQTGGSLTGGYSSYMIPIERKGTNHKKSDSKMMVNMVSPTEQTVQIAEKQLEKSTKTLHKRRKTQKRVHSSKNRRSVRRNKVSKKVKAKRQKVVKKSYKKRKLPSKRRIVPDSDILN